MRLDEADADVGQQDGAEQQEEVGRRLDAVSGEEADDEADGWDDYFQSCPLCRVRFSGGALRTIRRGALQRDKRLRKGVSASFQRSEG